MDHYKNYKEIYQNIMKLPAKNVENILMQQQTNKALTTLFLTTVK